MVETSSVKSTLGSWELFLRNDEPFPLDGALYFDDLIVSILLLINCDGIFCLEKIFLFWLWQSEKICFIMDESNVLDSSFLERMNTLLANGEVPGLFEGDEYTTLMTQCKEGAIRDGFMLDSGEELYKWFTQQVTRLFWFKKKETLRCDLNAEMHLLWYWFF